MTKLLKNLLILHQEILKNNSIKLTSKKNPNQCLKNNQFPLTKNLTISKKILIHPLKIPLVIPDLKNFLLKNQKIILKKIIY